MSEIDLRGVYPATTTPFDGDGSIDHDQLRADARRLEAAGVDGLVPVGSTGESATLSHDEHVAVVETTAEAVDLPVIAGAGSNNTREAVSLARRSAEAGADALLHISPYYNRPEPDGMLEHYRTVADAVDRPTILYDVPARTGRGIDADTTVELARHPSVRGYKAASGDLGLISEVAERTRDEEFVVLSGDDALTLPILSVGGTGAISVAANVEPRRVGRLVRAALDGAFDRARRLHHELGPLYRALAAETNPIPVKEAMRLRGHGSARLRPPLSRLSRGPTERLRTVLDDLAADDESTDRATAEDSATAPDRR